MLIYDQVQFPKLAAEGFTETSPKDFAYNCIAWAAGDNGKFWWPKGKDDYGNEVFWPRKIPRKLTIPAFIKAFASLGYEECMSGDFESGFEKVALYAANDKPTHAARQLSDGNWTHKFGRNIDFTASLVAVEGPFYGKVVRFLRRSIVKKAKSKKK